MNMNKLDLKIFELYKKNFLSAKQIADELHISFSKVRYILEKSKTKRRTISDAIRFLNLTKFKKGSFKIKEKLSQGDRILKVAGTMLYWGEGTKGWNTVAISNSDPEMLKIFLKFLRDICGVSENRIRALLHIYADHNEKKLIKFWSTALKIPESQFSKTFIHKKKAGTYKKNSEYGTLSLRYSDKSLLDLINSWIMEFIKNNKPA